MKQITITVPDNCELKQDSNTYTIIEKEKEPHNHNFCVINVCKKLVTTISRKLTAKFQ